MDEYNFKEAMKQNIKENIQPLLLENRFKKYSTNKYIRESNGLLQIITFRIGKDNLRAYASYIPLFVPLDNVLESKLNELGDDGWELVGYQYRPQKSNLFITTENIFLGIFKREKGEE